MKPPRRTKYTQQSPALVPLLVCRTPVICTAFPPLLLVLFVYSYMFYCTSAATIPESTQSDHEMHSQCWPQPAQEECVGSVHNANAVEVHCANRRRSWLFVMRFLMHCTLLSLYLKYNHY